MKYPFPKSDRLRTRQQYLRYSRERKCFEGAFVYLEVKPNHSNLIRLGITVTRKFGNAPQRNRLKRIAREAFRLNLNLLPKGFDLIVKPKFQAKTASMQNIASDLLAWAESTNTSIATSP